MYMINNLIKVIDELDITEILDEYHSMEPGFVWTDYGFKGKQMGLQYIEGEDPWSSATGRIKPEFMNTTRELEYTILNPYFKETVFETLINKYKLIRTRLMWLGSCAGYTMHCDSTPRIHLPLVTNQYSYFFFKDHVPMNMEVGKVFWVDTRKPHAAFNCSRKNRLHLIGVVSE